MAIVFICLLVIGSFCLAIFFFNPSVVQMARSRERGRQPKGGNPPPHTGKHELAEAAKNQEGAIPDQKIEEHVRRRNKRRRNQQLIEYTFERILSKVSQPTFYFTTSGGMNAFDFDELQGMTITRHHDVFVHLRNTGRVEVGNCVGFENPNNLRKRFSKEKGILKQVPVKETENSVQKASDSDSEEDEEEKEQEEDAIAQATARSRTGRIGYKHSFFKGQRN